MTDVEERDLRSWCRVATNFEGDSFVGIKSQEDGVKVYFPLGYDISGDEKELRQDIINLIAVLSKHANRKEQQLPINQIKLPEKVDFPIQAYMSIISDYINNDYYTENEIKYKKNYRGKINWARTIKHQKALMQDTSPIYLEYIVKDSVSNDESLISLVHEYCVYESFEKLGWIYTSLMPRKPRIRNFDKKMFLSVVYEKLGRTFNDKHKELFNSMIAMINYLGQKDVPKRFYFGTERFEYVWQKLIDYTFGVCNKGNYFPRTSWHLGDGGKRQNNALEPDTIMLCNGKVYVLDAKYYKYGVTGNPWHLPESTSINKQITYGEYIATNPEKFGDVTVYNAFLMPFNRCDSTHFYSLLPIKNIGESTAVWKTCTKEYERVQGILIDVKFLMNNVVKENQNEILRLSAEIEKAFKKIE